MTSRSKPSRSDPSEPALKSRRDVLTGRLAASPDVSTEQHVSSLVVHARPERLPDVLASLGSMQGVEVHGQNTAGKVVVTLETATEQEVVLRMGEIGELPGVLSTALVFHHFETAEDAE